MKTEEIEKKEKKGGGLAGVKIVSLCLFVGILAVGGAYQLLYPKPSYSESEKRDLAQMPKFSVESLFSGRYFSEIGSYYSDTFPFREFFVTLAADFNDAKGIRYDNIKIYGGPDQGEDLTLEEEPPTPTPTLVAPPTPTVSATPTPTSPPVVSATPTPTPMPEESAAPVPTEEAYVAPPEKVNNVIIYNNEAFECYGGSESAAMRYAGVLNAYQELMPNATLYNILVPTHAQINLLPTKYGYLTGDQGPLMRTVFNNLDSRVKPVDILQTLTDHSGEYLYYRTDHHWTAEGAFYAYEVFSGVAGQGALKREECVRTENEGFFGSLYAATKDRRLKNNPDSVVAYQIPYDVSVTKYDKKGTPTPGFLLSPSASYLGFLGGDNPFMSITTTNTNGRKLLIVKESYGNVFSTIVTGNYEQVFVADSRYCPFNIVDLVNDYGVDDVIFINNMFAATTGVRIGEIEALKDKTMKYEG